ncbi:ABC transporter ATP-binding protein [Flavobacteriaceae bacterium]|uniref:dipeptide ABC transporter ATP-binding protein n=1 Tax=Candidatus Arcticimaribacter forsetii TaxID=2820661 RepID=UPI0020776BD5|nr:ABC transporter ATP-binding protein [Candidatus Arcticimaribacter forsetii]MDA8699231.1 ABC transporter ATP-binding protein [Flavobacteriaceae bacterium]MDB2326158.1 ABC transporter ATP-binding protein [Flavobacteriaceae bacterium]MDB2329044.1 ABC transporter ATP-binding protein [Flavobacteriaceae bacterium]MDB2345369.1 ABC transporter ATP-binding protein [Flavobacteriaceae bacterium]MDB4621138.1 ABC transporter ATP-binding protein [Flavobacteriaceae bacterium]
MAKLNNKNNVKVRDFSLSIKGKTILKNISFEIKTNEIVAMVGESGSGKSLTALSLLGLLPTEKISIDSGSIQFNNKELLNLDEAQWRTIRGNQISMVFQEPQSSLNPTMRCGHQVEEIIKEHYKNKYSADERKSKVINAFDRVKLPNPERIYSAYPHEISGGQKQRVMIAMALMNEPSLLIADEPTTALDVQVQKEIIDLLKELQQEYKMSILFISHDLSLVSQLADKIVVLYQGSVVEIGTPQEIFKTPKEQYTRALIQARPKPNKRLKKLPTIEDFKLKVIEEELVSLKERNKRLEKIYAQEPLLSVRNLNKTYTSRNGFFGKQEKFTAINDLSFDLYPGETLGLVGASGCGKSTLGKALVYLNKPSKGEIFYKGKSLSKLNSSEIRRLRTEVQFIFQDPYAALHPQKKIGNAILEPIEAHQILPFNQRKNRVIDLLDQVGLNQSYFNRYPHELSGGQRQRVVIARALAVDPSVLICDESVAALDISVQAQVLNLLNELQEKLKLSYLFISHDLSVVQFISDKIMVMDRGEIVEYKEADELYRNPQEKATQKLIEAIPKVAF